MPTRQSTRCCERSNPIHVIWRMFSLLFARHQFRKGIFMSFEKRKRNGKLGKIFGRFAVLRPKASFIRNRRKMKWTTFCTFPFPHSACCSSTHSHFEYEKSDERNQWKIFSYLAKKCHFNETQGKCGKIYLI